MYMTWLERHIQKHIMSARNSCFSSSISPIYKSIQLLAFSPSLCHIHTSTQVYMYVVEMYVFEWFWHTCTSYSDGTSFVNCHPACLFENMLFSLPESGIRWSIYWGYNAMAFPSKWPENSYSSACKPRQIYYYMPNPAHCTACCAVHL